jgi:hypothetical protein
MRYGAKMTSDKLLATLATAFALLAAPASSEPPGPGQFKIIQLGPEKGVVLSGTPHQPSTQFNAAPRIRAEPNCDLARAPHRTRPQGCRPPTWPKGSAGQQAILKFMIPDAQSARLSYEVAEWTCRNPDYIRGKIIPGSKWNSDHEDGDWGVETKALLRLFDRPEIVPALHGFVHSPCPRSVRQAGTCWGGLDLIVSGVTPAETHFVLAHDAAEALDSGPDCPLRLLEALTRWYQPKATIHSPPVP